MTQACISSGGKITRVGWKYIHPWERAASPHYLKRPVGKENVIIQNKTSMNNTLDDRGEEAGLSRSVSGSQLGSLATVSFAVIQPREGWKSSSRRGPLSVTQVYPSIDHIKVWVEGDLQSPTDSHSQKGFLRYILFYNFTRKALVLFISFHYWCSQAELGFREAGGRLLGPGITAITLFTYSADPKSLHDIITIDLTSMFTITLTLPFLG